MKMNDETSFSKYYVSKIETKDANVLIDQRSFFDIPVKNKEAYEKTIEMSRNIDYKTGNLLDYEYYSSHHNVVAIDLGKQIKCETKVIE